VPSCRVNGIHAEDRPVHLRIRPVGLQHIPDLRAADASQRVHIGSGQRTRGLTS
jgi:hypothetical protein